MLQALHFEIKEGQRRAADSALAMMNGPLRGNFVKVLEDTGVRSLAIWHIDGDPNDHVFVVIDAIDPKTVMQALFHPGPDDPVMAWARQEAGKVSEMSEDTSFMNPLFAWKAPCSGNSEGASSPAP